MKKVILGLLVTGIMTSGGCLSRAIKEGAGLALGAKGVYAQMEAPTTPLQNYDGIVPGTMKDDFGGKVPRQLMRTFPGILNAQLAEEGVPTRGSGNVLDVLVRVVYYEQAGMTGHVFGPFEEVVAEVFLVERSSNRRIGRAYCIGRSTESVNKGVEKKTEGLAKGVVKWILKNYPEGALKKKE